MECSEEVSPPPPPLFAIPMSFPVFHRENMHCHFLCLEEAECCGGGGSGGSEGWRVSIALASHHLFAPLPQPVAVACHLFLLNWDSGITFTAHCLPLCRGLLLRSKRRNFFLWNCAAGVHLLRAFRFHFWQTSHAAINRCVYRHICLSSVVTDMTEPQWLRRVHKTHFVYV